MKTEMTNRRVVFILAGLALVIGLVVWWAQRPYPQLSLKSMSVKEATRLSVERLERDHQADWKVVLNFYGKVVDENNQPVSGAMADLQWNTVSTPGTAFKKVWSGPDGLFSLTGQRGKCLGVRVEKKGYYTVDGGAGHVSFEYANPSLSWWHEPDANNPVIFHLYRKGGGANLFSKILDIPLSQSHPQNLVDLMQGSINPEGVLAMTADESHFLPGNQPFPWTFSLKMREGGLIETSEHFPFLAPASGYAPTIDLDMTNTDRAIWKDGVKKTYYFHLPSTNTYGRVAVTKVVGLPVVRLNYAYNLIPGNRILEPASKD